MSHIENVLSRTDLDKKNIESLKYIRQHSEAAYDGLISGLGAMGNALFWACDNENYTEAEAKEDLRGIGEMMIYIPGVIAALKFNADEADFNIKERDKTPKR